ncbi:MAG: Gfo/Idh/MocA family oxidoreductase [Clostridia bacterium]|nr:Gfo/Idh/MocA family oxidoreductase [Clostridia bacterium]
MSHKLGVIGYGGMACWHHQSIRANFTDLEVVAAYDISAERLGLAEKNGLITFDSAEGFLDSHLFDIVLVATPNNFHCEYVCRALEAGYTVICEKPVALNCAELDRMEETAKRTGKLFSVHQNRRWDKDYRIVKKAYEEGLIGKPFTVESRIHGQGGMVHGWREFKVAGGGMVYDWGVHMIDQMLDMIPSKVVSVYANLHRVRTLEVDDYFKLVMRFENGITSQIEVGTFHLVQLPRWYACGDGGALVINDWDCTGKIIHTKDSVMKWEPVVVQTKAGPTRTMAPRPADTLEELPLPEVETSWASYYRNILDTIDGKADLIVTIPSVRRVLRVIEACFESDEKGEGIKTDI